MFTEYLYMNVYTIFTHNWQKLEPNVLQAWGNKLWYIYAKEHYAAMKMEYANNG